MSASPEKALGTSRWPGKRHQSSIQFTLVNMLRLHNVVVSCMGPHGSPKVIQMHPTSSYVRVTTSSSRLFKNLPFTCPSTKMLISLTSAHRRANSDAGLLALALATELVQTAAKGAPRVGIAANATLRVGSDVPPPLRIALDGYGLALKAVIGFLGGGEAGDQDTKSKTKSETVENQHLPWLRVSWDDPAPLLGLVYNALSKPVCGLRRSERRHIAELILQAHLRGYIDANARRGQQSPRRVQRVRVVMGSDACKSRLLNGVLLDTPSLPMGASFSRRFGSGDGSGLGAKSTKVAIYSCSLMLHGDEKELGKQIRVERVARSDDSAGWSASDVQLKRMRDLVNTWTNVSVGVVASQKRIHPYLKALLIERGVLPLERLSARHVDAVAVAAGATPIANLIAPRPELVSSLGELMGHDVLEIGGRTHLLLHPVEENSSRVLTVLAYAKDEEAGEELKEACETGLRLLKSLRGLDSRVCPGAGLTEALVASYLYRVEARQGTSVALAFGCRAMASALVRISRFVGQGLTESDLSVQASAFGGPALVATWRRVLGRDAREGSSGARKGQRSSRRPRDPPIITDGLTAKMRAIELGVGAACAVLRVDGVLSR